MPLLRLLVSIDQATIQGDDTGGLCREENRFKTIPDTLFDQSIGNDTPIRKPQTTPANAIRISLMFSFRFLREVPRLRKVKVCMISRMYTSQCRNQEEADPEFSPRWLRNLVEILFYKTSIKTILAYKYFGPGFLNPGSAMYSVITNVIRTTVVD